MGEQRANGDAYGTAFRGYLQDIPAGYKRTEAGLIPQGWAVARLRDRSEIVMGQSPPGSSYNRSGVGTALINGPTEFTRIHPIRIQWTTQPSRICKRGDLLICVRGSSTGRTNYADDTYAIGRGVAAMRAKSDNDTQYLSYQVILGVSKLLDAATGSTFPSIDGASLREVLVLSPPLPEQRAIAAVLSDVDELIGSLEALIAKKRAIKQAAMQELLTGRTRLPGFGREWETRPLRDLADCLDHVRVPLNEAKRRQMPGPYPYCGANGIVDHIADYVLDDDVILMAEDGGHFAEHAHRPIAYRMTGKIWVNNHAHVLKAKPGLSQAFLFFALVHKNILPFLASGTRSKLNRGEMNKIVVCLPRNTIEQRAIATILSDMDSEIAALESRLDKTRAIKQGMMQQLLTGSIRLPIPDDDTEDDDAHDA